MNDRFTPARNDVYTHAKKMWEAGLVVASAGNVSRRAGDEHIAITPTSIPYEVLAQNDITVVHLPSGRVVDSRHAPSYELPMHKVIYRSRPDVSAIVHTHAPFVTTLSVLRRPLPPIIDEMMIHFGGTVDVSDYAFTGTEDVGTNVVRALGDRTAAILANHGNVCVASTLDRAMLLAITMEWCARVYVEALRVGKPVELPKDAISAGRRLFEERSRRSV
ncbi:MAG TPA: class II aldolase/adducin family protein [Thermoanaerobaculia bacterium]|nr:class II aldolase/adducin family protein [Thermoanaerobaculia bacterium]